MGAIMGYTIVQLPQITPQYIVVNGATGPESRLNPGAPVQRPTGTLLYADISDRYGVDPGRRVELWDDPAGVATNSAIFTACPYLRDWREKQIRAEGEVRLAKVAAPYTKTERETWPYQRAEALAWSANPTALTPYCDAIAVGRGNPRDQFLRKVLDNSTLFTNASTALLGQQQALIDQVWAATTIDALLRVAWP